MTRRTGSVAVRKKIGTLLDWDHLIDKGEPIKYYPGCPNVGLFNANPFNYGIANMGSQSIAHYLLTRNINVYFAFADTMGSQPFLNDPQMTPDKCDVIGISIPFEDTYLNVLRMLEQAGLPI